jgi:DNA-binding GntR family transcriptional regulator
MRKGVLLFAAATIAVTPAIAQRAARYLNPQDVAEAQRMHTAMVQELGGAETGPRAAYVESIGRRVGAVSGVANAGQALHFSLLNCAVE